MEWLGIEELLATLGVILGALALVFGVIAPWTKNKWDDKAAAMLRKWADRIASKPKNPPEPALPEPPPGHEPMALDPENPYKEPPKP